MKRHNLLLLLILIPFFLLNSPAIAAEPNVSGVAGILIDAETGKVLWQLNESERRAPASITKLITALLAVEKGNLSDEIVISEEAVDTIGSIVYLRAGETQTLENLLYATMLNSGNDAARAIAEHIGGTIENFITMMNQKAKEIGAHSTNFVNPNGLSEENHYTTAYDIALITKAAAANQTLRKIIGTQTRKWEGMDWQSQLSNLNELLWNYEGIVGGKTGYTSDSGHCLTAVAKRDGLELISVILGCTSRQAMWKDSTTILNYGFENFHKLKLVTANEKILTLNLAEDEVPILAKEEIKYLTNKNLNHLPSQSIAINNIELPLTKGDEIGTITFELDGEILKKTSLIAGQDVAKPITWVDIYLRVTLALIGVTALLFFLRFLLRSRRKRSIYASKTGKSYLRNYP